MSANRQGGLPAQHEFPNPSSPECLGIMEPDAASVF